MSQDTSTKDLPEAETANDAQNHHPLHALQMAIAGLPDVDAKRVEEVLRKLRAGQIDILGDEAQQQASADRIAKKIIDEL